MSKITLPAARSLNRRERKALKAAGADPQFRPDGATIAELNDRIVEFISTEVYHIDGPEYDDVPYADFIALADKTYRLTYALADDVKNS